MTGAQRPAGRYSLRARLLLGAACVLVAFMAAAGYAVQRAHADSVRAVHFGRLQSAVYLLLARAELDDAGALVLPQEWADPRLTLPGSGLYASINNVRRQEQWRSPSSVGLVLPFRTGEARTGEWAFEDLPGTPRGFLAATYAVNWEVGRQKVPLVLSVVEDRADFDREVAIFARTLWGWLGAAGVLLLLAQLWLLRWALAPLRGVSAEIQRVEDGQQARIEGRYPEELVGLTDNLNALIEQERERQKRYKEALSFLAHSLKTPLAVLRNALGQPAQLGDAVRAEVARMDDIVQHQLGRAAAGGATRFATPVQVEPVLRRIRDALAKVHADRALAIEVACASDLAWRIDEGDLFEIAGNLMDNAAKWARTRVAVHAAREGGHLVLRVDDDGPGFRDTQSVLQMHVRGDERVPGHGVGLTVVSDIVKSHRGELLLGASHAGGGRVEVRIPPP